MNGTGLRLFAAALVALALSACGTIETFDGTRSTVDPDEYVVAFSFDTSAFLRDEASGNHWVFDRAYIYPSNRTVIGLAGAEPGLTVIMLKSPTQVFSFGDLGLDRSVGEDQRERYGARVPGPRVQLQKGVVTYVGTLTVEGIDIDEDTGRPAAMTMKTRDGWDDEARVWRRTFAVLEDEDPVRNIAADWESSGVVVLEYYDYALRGDVYSPNRIGDINRSGDLSRNKGRPPR